MSANKPEEVWAKSVAALEEAVLLAKSHVSGYTRKDGTFVKEHEDGRVAAPAKEKKSAVMKEIEAHNQHWQNHVGGYNSGNSHWFKDGSSKSLREDAPDDLKKKVKEHVAKSKALKKRYEAAEL